MTQKTTAISISICGECLRTLAPTIAALLACLAAKPMTDRIADVWFGLRTTGTPPAEVRTHEELSVRDEPIRPVPPAIGLDAQKVGLGQASKGPSTNKLPNFNAA
jgi:hypothetical protein